MKKLTKKILLFIVIAYILNIAIANILIIPKNDLIKNNQYYPTLRWEEFYLSDSNSINLIFLGSSHCYRSFVPNVFDSILNINSFNLGSASQTPLTSYYVLKEILNIQKPEHIILELSWFNLIETSSIVGVDNSQFSNAFYNFEHFKSTSNQLSFIINGFGYKEYPYLLFPAIRYRNNWVQALNNLILNKPFKKLNEEYSHKGYVMNFNVATAENFKLENAIYLQREFSKEKVIPKLSKYIVKIIDLCKENNIELKFVTAPIAPSTLSQINNYNEINTFYDSIAKEYKIDYIDYNILIHMFDDSLFKDDNHFNHKGAIYLSEKYSKSLKI